MVYKLTILALLFLNSACSIWSAQSYFHKPDIYKAILSSVYGASCLILLIILIKSRNYYQWPFVFLLLSSLSFFVVDRLRDKEELLLMKWFRR